jgi:hypothetical protein
MDASNAEAANGFVGCRLAGGDGTVVSIAWRPAGRLRTFMAVLRPHTMSTELLTAYTNKEYAGTWGGGGGEIDSRTDGQTDRRAVRLDLLAPEFYI